MPDELSPNTKTMVDTAVGQAVQNAVDAQNRQRALLDTVLMLTIKRTLGVGPVEGLSMGEAGIDDDLALRQQEAKIAQSTLPETGQQGRE